MVLTAAVTAPDPWWVTVLDSQLIAVSVGALLAGGGALWVSWHAGRAAKAAAAAETMARHRLQARRLLTAASGFQEVLRGEPLVQGRDSGSPSANREPFLRALEALRRVEARHWDMILDCPPALVAPANDLRDMAREAHAHRLGISLVTYPQNPESYTIVERAMVDFIDVCRIYFTNDDAGPGLRDIPPTSP